MAIDTKSLTDIITEFRALQSKDAVSPESLGYRDCRGMRKMSHMTMNSSI